MLGRVLTGLLLAWSAAGQDTFRANHERGEASIRTGDIGGAVPWLRRAYAMDPADYSNAWDLATACVETKQWAEARRVVTDLLRRGERSELHGLLGEIEEGEGHAVEAVREFETAARAEPSEKNIFDLGSALLNHAGFAQAVSIFEFGVGKYAGSARMRVGLGVAYYSLSRWAEAVETLCAAVDLDPRDTRALDFLGKMRDVAPEMAPEVRRRLGRFVELYPKNAAANYYLALSLTDAGDDAGAEKRLMKALALDGQLAEAHLHLGILYQKRGTATDAIRQFEAAVRLHPGLKAAHYRLAVLYKSRGQEEKALRELETFQSLK